MIFRRLTGAYRAAALVLINRLNGQWSSKEQATGLEREVMLAARKGQVRRMFHAFWESSLPWMGSEQPSLWGAFPPGNLAFGNSVGSP